MGKHNELHDPLGPTHTCDLTCACLRQIRPQKQAFQQAIHPDDPFTHRVETGCAAGRCVEAIISNMNATSTFLRDKRILFNVRLTVHLETSSSKLSMRKSCISSRYIYGSSSKSLARVYITRSRDEQWQRSNEVCERIEHTSYASIDTKRGLPSTLVLGATTVPKLL